MPNFNIHITPDSHYRAILVTIVIVKQTSRTGVTEHFLDILQESYIILYDILEGNYTIIKATGSHTYIDIETYI